MPIGSQMQGTCGLVKQAWLLSLAAGGQPDMAAFPPALFHQGRLV